MITTDAIANLGGVRGLAGRSTQALVLAWRSAPVSFGIYLILTLAQGLLPAGVALLTKLLVDAVQAGRNDGTPILLAVGLGLLGVATVCLPQAVDYLKSRMKRGLTLLVQDRLFRAVNGFDGMVRFERPEFLNRLSLAQQSAMMAPDQVTTSLFGIVQSLLTVLSMLGILIYLSPWIALITVAAAIPAFFVQVSVSRKLAQYLWSVCPRNRRQLFYQGLMLDLAAVKEIRLFGLGGFLLDRMRRETLAINAGEERVDRRTLLSEVPIGFLGAATAAGGLIWMIGEAADGRFTIGDVTAFIAAVAGVQGATAGIVTGAIGAYQALLMFGHFLDVSTMGNDLPARSEPAGVAPLRRAIEFRDVWFRYADDAPWVLRGVDLTMEFGKSTALVGLNGAGKSTVVKLLGRLYDPTRGSICWDGVDLRDLDITQLRERISVVFQDYMCYDLSASENIGVGDLARLDDRLAIDAAAEDAGVAPIVSRLPRGYDTMLSRIFVDDEEGAAEHGVTLSGGQWQRMALARALMRGRRDLMILDEPSAGLDAEAEQAVHDGLREQRRGATTVLISHRMGAVRHADRIVVLRGGRVQEVGSHDDLMLEHGEYARLFSLQAANYVEAGAHA